MTERQLIYSAWKTPDGTILHSRHRHDYCEHFDSVSKEWYILDGGADYQRCSVNEVPPEDLTLYTDDPHEKIREVFIWKSYGKNFSQPEGVYTLLKDLAEDHLGNIIATQTHLPDYILEMFRNEQLFRKGKKMNEKCNKCWSLNDEYFFDDWCDLIDELEQKGLGVGTEFFEGDKVDIRISDYVNIHGIDSMLEQFDDWVYEDVGEIADCDFYNVSQDAKKELQGLIQSWAEKHVKLPYWKVQNVVKKVVTKEDLE